MAALVEQDNRVNEALASIDDALVTQIKKLTEAEKVFVELVLCR